MTTKFKANSYLYSYCSNRSISPAIRIDTTQYPNISTMRQQFSILSYPIVHVITKYSLSYGLLQHQNVQDNEPEKYDPVYLYKEPDTIMLRSDSKYRMGCSNIAYFYYYIIILFHPLNFCP